jgi:DNA-binding NarL/FixJ family response regulator
MTESRPDSPLTLLLLDEPSVRRGMRMLIDLNLDIRVLGEAGDVTAAMELAAALHPDMLVADLAALSLEHDDGTANLRQLAGRCAVIVLSLDDSAATRSALIDAGAAAFLPKYEACGRLVATIRSVGARAGGHIAIPEPY